MAKQGSYRAAAGLRKTNKHSMNKKGDISYGLLRNTASRRDAYNYARRVSMGGKGG